MKVGSNSNIAQHFFLRMSSDLGNSVPLISVAKFRRPARQMVFLSSGGRVWKIVRGFGEEGMLLITREGA
jgi:hypothetical protein